MNILVVDDEIELCNLIAFQLEDEGYGVTKAYGFNEAIDQFKKKKTDVILSDMRMPGGSGIDLFKVLKEENELEETQFFIISGFVPMDEAELTKMGISAVIKKPISFQDLLSYLPAKA